jgi:hypothetical protein
MTGRIPARVARLAGATVATCAVIAAGAGTAGAALVYNNIPSPLPGNLPSQAFEATSTSEVGGQVQLAGTQRKNPTLTVTMSSWACQNLKSGSACSTTHGSTFEWPITVNVYEVGPGDQPGAKIATQTNTFAIPYRPSPNKKCPLTSEGVVGWGPKCYSGKTHNIKFQLAGVTLPTKAIIGVAYNTSDYGYSPTHGPDIGQNSLNVAAREPGETGPSVGAYPRPADAYLNSTWSGAYCNGAEGTGTFRLDAGCWTGYQLAFKVQATK